MSRWGDAFRTLLTPDTTDTIDTNPIQAPGEGSCVNSVNCVSPSESESPARSLAHAAPPPLARSGARPPQGADNPAAALDGLRRAALQRPTSWADPGAAPPPGAWCSCCKGGVRWTERENPNGWRCAVCHPADHLAAGAGRYSDRP
ncbi:MAG: hypothetical protein JOY71_19610 [Acetobacteraceae bacterium]|nr:hypothetical protein [Acetobacteraceae bacterium]